MTHLLEAAKLRHAVLLLRDTVECQQVMLELKAGSLRLERLQRSGMRLPLVCGELLSLYDPTCGSAVFLAGHERISCTQTYRPEISAQNFSAISLAT